MAISQREEVLTHLKKGLPITSWEAIHEFRATRLSAIIYDLRKAGYTIITENLVNEKTGKRYGSYTLIKENK
tara:strand:- start:143 stop:358 length:216 start_codon:yes stop_codon:yes gene_type:complete